MSKEHLAIFLAAVALALTSCSREQATLFGNIKTEVVAIHATAHGQPGYHPVPDSLRLRFDRILRLLRVVVTTDGCCPKPEAKVEESPGRLYIQVDMQDSCRCFIPIIFDVEIFVSPVHEDVFRLIVEQRAFGSSDPGGILMNQIVDVRQLPGLK